ncbi:MAG: hypothetical protein PHX38_11090 [Sulfuricella sp.]|nr:hypothetical protein [Sulfuricella sp.]
MQRIVNSPEREHYVSLLEHVGISPERSVEAMPNIGAPDWSSLAIPDGIGLGKKSFATIACVAKHFGDDELVIVDTFSPTPSQHVIACSVDYYEFKHVLSSNDDFAVFDTSVIGRSGKWAVILRGLDDGILVTDRQVMDLLGSQR